MNARMIGLIGLCALAACNSEPADDAAPAADAAMAPAGTTEANGPTVMEPAPDGLPTRIAREVITASGQACAEVENAERGADGTITVTCSSGETYHVYTAPGQGPVATPR